MHRRRATITAAERRALRSLDLETPRGIRQPRDLDPQLAAMADRAFERIVDVMEERVPEKKQKGVLTAAAMVREEILGPIAQKMEVEGNLEHILLASMANTPSPELDDKTPIAIGSGDPTRRISARIPDPDQDPDREA